MLEKVLPKSKRLVFNVLKKKDEVLDFLLENKLYGKEGSYDLLRFREMKCEFYENENEGKYFTERKECNINSDAENYLETSNMFTT